MSLDKRAHAFKSQNIAEALVEVGKREMAGISGDRMPTGREVRVVKTPSAGIAAATLNTGEMELEFALCEIKLAGVALTTPVTKSTKLTDGTTTAKIKVWNITATAIGGDEFITAVRIGGAWFAQAGGGGEAGTANYVIVANSGITAASWPTSGTGTGDIWELAVGGASWSAIGGSSVNVRNPWEETIASGSRMICYKDGDYYVVIQASCPAV